MSLPDIHQEGLDYESLTKIDSFDNAMNHRAWVIYGDVVETATQEEYEQFCKWIRELGGNLISISRPDQNSAYDGRWEGIEATESGIVLVSKPIFQRIGDEMRLPKSAAGRAFNSLAYAKRQRNHIDKAATLSPEVLANERTDWIDELNPVPGTHIDYGTMRYAWNNGLLQARLYEFGKRAAQVVGGVISYVDPLLEERGIAVE